MSKARELINKIQEFIPLSHFDVLTAKTIETAFRERLNSLGYDGIQVDVTIDLDEGPLVTFSDSEGDEVTILFYICDERGPIASVVSDDDEQIEIQLDPLDPFMIQVGGKEFIDLTDLTWMNKSVLATLLLAGEVDSKTEAQKSMVSFGGKKRKLPIVVKKDKMTDKDKNILDRVKSLPKRKTNTNKKFAAKIRKK